MQITTPSPNRNPLILSKPGLKPGFVLLIAPSGSYRIAPYLNAARNLGIKILVVSNSRFSLVPELAEGIVVDFKDHDRALRIIQKATDKLDIVCVLATDDTCVSLSSAVAQHLQLPHNHTQAALLTQRKDLSRQVLKDACCNSPDFRVIKISDAKKQSEISWYPAVLKPLSLSASRGVIRVNNPVEFIEACRRINAILEKSEIDDFAGDHILIESYLDGPEYAVEAFMIDNQFHLLTIFDKPEPLCGPYFEETYYITPTQLCAESKSALLDEVEKCCRAIGLKHGPVHAEARITKNGVTVLEIASRTIGGQCGQLIEFSLQQKLEELVILGLCGIPPELKETPQSAGVLMIPIRTSGLLKRVEGLTDALQVRNIKDIEIHVGQGYEIIPLPEGSSYLGFIFAQAADNTETYNSLKTAFEKLRFVTQPVWHLDQQAS